MPTIAIDARDACAPQPRGWGRYARELIAALRTEEREGLTLRTIERGGPGPELVFEQLALPLLLRRERIDAVHAPNCFLPLVRPCPGVVTIHDLAFEAHPRDFSARTRWKYRTLASRAARSAQRVICDATFTRDDICSRYGVDPDRVRVVPLAPALSTGDAAPPPGPYLLAIGDLRAKKNLRRLVEAYRRLRAEGLEHRLVLAGLDSGEGERLRAGAAGAPLELRGYVSDTELDALLRGADLLVHPSLYEGFGLPLLEAMARGCPVAAADATALPETGGEATLWFDPLDVDAIATAISRAVGDRGLHARLADAGRRHVAGFSWARTARATLDVYAEVLA